jgi:hypothetical protein
VTKSAKKKRRQQKAATGLVVTLDQMEKLMRSVLNTEAVR